MKLIIGLGNPGEKYNLTRHNIGFRIVEKIAQLSDVVFRLENQFVCENADFNINDERIKLAKPQTFMNNSGQAISKIKEYYKIDSEDIWVIHDDVDLPVGTIRITLGGSSAGHKGVQSIIDNISDNFWRIRIGVDRSQTIPTEEWVLKNFDNPAKIEEIIDKTADFIINALSNKEFLAQTIVIK